MNKRVSVLFYLLFICITVNSQITKGNWLIGGSVNFNSTKENSEAIAIRKNSVSTLFSGNVGYFIANNLVSGIKINYLYSFQKYAPAQDSSYHQFKDQFLEVGPFVRYYFLNTNNNKRINIFSELNYNYGFNWEKTYFENKNYYYYFNSKRITPLMGCAVYFNENIAIEFTFGYTFYNYKSYVNSLSIYTNSIITGIGFQCHL